MLDKYLNLCELDLKTQLGEIYSAAMNDGNYLLAFKILQFFINFESKTSKNNTNFKNKKFSTQELEDLLDALEKIED